jgi:hypothetical protein
MARFTLISFDAAGNVIQNAAIIPAFYALVLDGVIVDYCTSIQAARYVAERLSIAA